MEIRSWLKRFYPKLNRFYRWEYFWLFMIVLAWLVMHFSIICYPADLILDENHYIPDARNIIEKHESLRQENVPLSKLLFVAGIEMFGDNPWGWRVLPILFSAITIILFYFLCRRLNMSRTASSIATFLLSTENMFFMLSGLAMQDIFCVTFMMASFLLYVYQRYINSGIAVGLAGLAKLNGILALPVTGVHWLFASKGRSRFFMWTIIFSIVVFFGLMPLFDLAIVQKFSDYLNPIKRVLTMMQLTSSLTFATVEHPSESPPWEWLYTYKPMPFNYMPHYTAAISFSIFALIVPVFGYMLYRAIKKDEAGLFGVAWFFGTYLIWIPATLITDRVTYIYYFYPAIGAICLGLGMGLSQLIDIFRERPRGKLKWFALSAVIFILAAHVFSFLILSPFIPVDFAKLVGLSTIQP